MTRDKKFWFDAIQLPWDYEEMVDIDETGVVTINYDLAITDELIKLADELRLEKGYAPLFDDPEDGWYNFYADVEDVNGGRLLPRIICIANNTEDDYSEYDIELTEEEAKWVYDKLNLETGNRIEQMLEEERKYYESNHD